MGKKVAVLRANGEWGECECPWDVEKEQPPVEMGYSADNPDYFSGSDNEDESCFVMLWSPDEDKPELSVPAYFVKLYVDKQPGFRAFVETERQAY